MVAGQLRIYPNPSTDIVYISGGESLTSVEINNLAGALLKTYD